MRRSVAVVLAVLLVGSLSLGGDLPDWSSDGPYAYSSAVVVQNPSDVAAIVKVTYPTPCDPATPDFEITVPPGTTQTVNVNAAAPRPWGAAAMVWSDIPVVATQTFLWRDADGATQWASHAGGAPAAATTWYLPEGSTHGGFETWILVQNPAECPANVEITYMTSGPRVAGPSIMLDPASQKQVAVADSLPGTPGVSAVVTSDVPIVASMSTYWNGGASNATSFGTSAPATSWYLPEGNTELGSGFETWVLVQNPGSSAAAVQVTYFGEGSPHSGPTMSVPPMANTRLDLADSFPDQMQFATLLTSDAPVVAAQEKTWDGGQGYNRTMGVPAPASQWYFPVARPHPDIDSWLVLQNVGTAAANVTLDYMSPLGRSDRSSVTLGSCERKSIDLPQTVNGQGMFSVAVTSDRPILAMQGSYWEGGTTTNVKTSFGTPAVRTTWFLPPSPFSPSQFWTGQSAGTSPVDDRDEDGVPDADDYCPDFPGSPAFNGC